MIESMTTVGGVLSSALSTLSGIVDQLLDLDFAAATCPELVECAREWEVLQRRSAVVTHALVAGLGASGAPGELGYRDPAALLADLLRLNPGEARARWRAAEELGPRRSLLGEPLAPQFEQIAEAQRVGTISGAHAKVIIAALNALTPGADVAHAGAVERILVEHAAEMDPNRLGSVAARLLAHLDPDGRRPSEADQQRRRTVTLAPTPDGSGYLEGRLTPELLAVLQTVLDPLSAPVAADDGTPDPRSPGQRRHDGLLDLCHRVLRDGSLPASGGVPTMLILTARATDFAQGEGFVSTAHGGVIPMVDALRLTDQADVCTVMLNAAGGIMSYGRTRRTASAAQRIAIRGRDIGCTFPGCSVPAPWTQVHHFQGWAQRGETSVDNQGLLCGYHHRSHEAVGWAGVMRDGVPYWIPPPHIDPEQKPRKNRYWQPERVDL